MTNKRDRRFDGGYHERGPFYFYKKIHELMPNEKKIIIDYIRSYDEESFEEFKEDCSKGWYSKVETKPPRKHTKAELEELKDDLMFMLFDIF